MHDNAQEEETEFKGEDHYKCTHAIKINGQIFA